MSKKRNTALDFAKGATILLIFLWTGIKTLCKREKNSS